MSLPSITKIKIFHLNNKTTSVVPNFPHDLFRVNKFNGVTEYYYLFFNEKNKK